MAIQLEPPPYNDESLSHVMKEWLKNFYRQLVGDGGLIPWDSVSKTGSDLSDIQTRLHGDLQNLTSDDHLQYLNRDGSRPMTGSLTMPKTSGVGIKVDEVSPTFGWRDLEGPINLPQTAAQRPTLQTYSSPVEDYAFSAGDHYGPLKFHIPHDYVPGSDLYIHVHWSHTGTTITGSIVFDYFIIYAKGHGQAAFSATPINLTHTVSSLTIGNTPQRQHRIDEIQLSATTPSASQLDSDNIEADGMIIIHFDVPTIPTITGGTIDRPFIHYVDIHYQSTNIGTKQKAPNFHV